MKISIRKKVPARNLQEAMIIIKKKYPFARAITYKFDKDFRFEKRDYENRTMSVAFVKDFRRILK